VSGALNSAAQPVKSQEPWPLRAWSMVYAAGRKRLYRCNFLLWEKNCEANGGNHRVATQKLFSGQRL